jgi:hypothetical protein
MIYFSGSLLFIMGIIFAVHAIRTGRQQWLWIILFFPVGGWIIYFFVNVLPDLQQSRTVRDAGDIIVQKINPTRKLKKLQEQLSFSDTIDNRLMLAQEYVNVGQYQEAVDLYLTCLEGVYEDEPFIILDLANALYLNNSFEEAKERLLYIKKHHKNYKNKDVSLLLAKTHENLDETDQALAEYSELVKVYPGEEARCRYALLLKKNGQLEESQRLFGEIIAGAKRSPGYYRRNQKKWINIAKQNLNQ